MDYQALSATLREDVLRIVYRAKAGHIGGDLSVLDILITLYYDQMNVDPEHMDDPNRDRFILSKGHSVEALYAVLVSRGFITREQLDTYFTFGSKLIGHPNNKLNGIEMNSGALGHGLSVCAGMALAAKRRGLAYRTYTVMGDGELAEGSIWEAAECANQYQLDNLCAVIDQNGLQISGATDQVMSHGDLAARLRAYGWHTVTVDGHSYPQLHAAFEEAKAIKGQPTAVIAKTVKGKGVPFMENNVKWHHKVPTAEEYQQALFALRADKG